MQTYSFVIKGATPLLMHKDDVELADVVTEWRMNPKNKNLKKPGDDRAPAWTWQTYLHHDGRHLAIPSDMLWTCLRDAATSVTMRGSKSFKESAAAGFFLSEEYLPLLVAGKQIPIAPIKQMADEPFSKQVLLVRSSGFELFTKRARINNSTKHVRVRPKFTEWSVQGILGVLAPELTFDVLQQIGEIAGRYKGLGDGRVGSPKKPWRYGQFFIEFTENGGAKK